MADTLPFFPWQCHHGYRLEKKLNLGPLFLVYIRALIKSLTRWDWRDGLTVKSVCLSCRGPGLGSQHPHRDLQPYSFRGYQCLLRTAMGIAFAQCTGIHAGKIVMCIK